MAFRTSFLTLLPVFILGSADLSLARTVEPTAEDLPPTIAARMGVPDDTVFADGDVFLTAVPPQRGWGAGRKVARLGMPGLISCRASYDDPHASDSSGYVRINAHLTVRCSGKVPSIIVSSTMCANGYDRCGGVSRRTSKGRDRIMVGGDLGCVPAAQTYQATGYGSIVFPPGYEPQSGLVGTVSPARGFSKAGICYES